MLCAPLISSFVTKAGCIDEEDGVIRTEIPALDITENTRAAIPTILFYRGHIDHRHIIKVGDPFNGVHVF